MTGTLNEDLCTFVAVSCRIHLGMRNVSACRLWDNVGKIWSSQTGHTWRCNATTKRWAFHAG